MSELTGPVIVVDDNTETAQGLLASFQSIGWSCLSVENINQLQQVCEDPLINPLFLLPSTYVKMVWMIKLLLISVVIF